MRLGPVVTASKRGSARRMGIGLAMLAIAAMTQGASPRAAQATMTVFLDKAKVVKYPPNTETIIVGNPIIADVTMLKNSGMLILTGKSFGETNLVFLDRAGAVLSESSLRVLPSGSMVTVQRGGDRESWECHPRCEPSVSLGDSQNFIKDAIGGVTARNGLVAPAAQQH